ARGGWPATLDINSGIAGIGKSWVGTDTGDLLGNSVDSGDMDGDGKDEVVLGATLADGNANSRASAGELYLYFGGLRASTPDVTPNVSVGNVVRIIGAWPGDRAGS